MWNFKWRGYSWSLTNGNESWWWREKVQIKRVWWNEDAVQAIINDTNNSIAEIGGSAPILKEPTKRLIK